MTRTFETITEPIDGVECLWQVPYTWSQPRRATHLDPSEGGIEVGQPILQEVAMYDEQGNQTVLDPQRHAGTYKNIALHYEPDGDTIQAGAQDDWGAPEHE